MSNDNEGNKMPTTEDRQAHMEHVLYCENAAVAASNRYERECAEIEGAVEPFLQKCIEYYDGFRMWQAEVDRYWADHPEQFDKNIFSAIKEISRKWQNVFCVVSDLLDAIKRSDYNVNLPTSNEIRNRYSLMLSIELMDNGPLPEHLSELANQAASDFEAGEVEEIVRG